MPSEIQAQPQMDEDIVISGISGRFPESDNIDELRENLYNNVDMVTEDERRWPIGFYGLPARTGKMKDLSKFDAQFFGVHGKQADNMDPQARLLLELTYEAIADAGINPQLLRGTRTGVYIGACASEVEEAFVQDVSKASGYALTGCSRSMFANRVSFTFDFQGPSYTMDTACSSSFMALQQAYLAIRSNECDQAVVGGVNICVRPATSIQFQKLNMLSPDGKCHYLDADANGFVRSETCSVIFLQRKSNAKRIYATVIHAKTNTDGNKEEGITYPSCNSQMAIMKQTIDEAGIDPLQVNYFEAHGIGTSVGDSIETKAIAQVFCQGRKEPLLIGSVKTNLGHAEPASGLNSIAKVLLTFQNKLIPANLHYNTPNTTIPELMNGIVKPVVENTPYQDGIVAINSLGWGGVNVHVLLKPHSKELDQSKEKIVDQIPRLILANGRTDDSVAHIFDFIEKNPDKVNCEFLALIQEIAQNGENSGMNSRGYMIADRHPDGQTVFPKEIVRVPEKRPLWFVYSGMGSQWTSMAKALMPIDIFRKSIEKSADILKDYNIDLMSLVLSDDENCLETMVAPFVAIASIQIALTDLLTKLGIEPDGIVGHSVGELGCAYADGAFNHEQMLLSAYWRGKCVEVADLPKGLMAAVGLSWEEAKARCPEGVVPACHNSQDSVTISGEYEATKKFVEELRGENIFAREVKSCGVSFHSYYMEAIAPELLKKLEDVIPEKTLRTNRWISSSVPESHWNEDDCRYSAPIYYVNNLKSPVLFHEAIQSVPRNAILIEIAPHCLLQPIVKRTLGSDISYVALMKRNNNDGNLNLLLSAIGKLYNLGLNPDLSALYPKVEFPVSRNVQSLSPLIKWDHSQTWLVTLYPEYFNPNNLSDYSVKIDLNEKNDHFYLDHCIDGRMLFPATGYLYLAWQMLSKTKGQFCDKTMVEFENVTLHRTTLLQKEMSTKFEIRLMESNGEFTISEGGSVVVTGRVFVPEKSPLKLQSLLTDGSVRSIDSIKLSTKDVYQELRLRGYDYGPNFQSIIEATSDSKLGKLKYNNWITLTDAMFQIGSLNRNRRGLYLPVRFQSVRCDPKILFEAIDQANGCLDVVNDERIETTVVPGLEIQGLKLNLVPRRLDHPPPILEKYQFTPYHQNGVLDEQIQLKLDEYLTVTKFLANQLIDLFKLKSIEKSPCQVNEMVLKNYLESSNDPILSALKKLLFAKNPENILNEKLEDLSSEFLSTPLKSKSYLGVLINLVVENLSSINMNIAEVNSSNVILVNQIRQFVEENGHPLHIDYTLLSKENKDLKSDVNYIQWNHSEPKLPLTNNGTDLLVYKDGFQKSSSINYESLLESFNKSIKDNGFLLAVFRSKISFAEEVLHKLYKIQHDNDQLDIFKAQAEKIGFQLVSSRSDNLTTRLLLFRKIDNHQSINDHTVIHVTSNKYEWIEKLKMKMSELQSKKVQGENIWLIGADHPANGLVGLVKCLRLEPGGDRIRCILQSPIDQSESGFPEFSLNEKVYAEIMKKDLVMNVYRNGQFGSFRHYDLDSQKFVQTEHAYLTISTPGDLSSFQWYESPNKYFSELPKELQNSSSLFTVYYAPLNFQDVMLATGKLPQSALTESLTKDDCVLGVEFSGRDQLGRRMMGIVPTKGLSTTVLVETQDLLWSVPDDWTMEQASTVPIAYSTAYYALVVRGELEHGESVLIHSGTGGVGQAAISICLSMGCKVFTTVGSEEKRNYLKKIFPELKDNQIANSHDTSFEQYILRQTNGRGCDLVLNSLSDEKLQASVRCLAQHGRFLEIGKNDLAQNNPLGMSAFLRNITFCGILLDALWSPSALSSPLVEIHRKMVSKLIKDGIKTGAVRPLKTNLFEMNQVEDAFRFMASGKHIGKVVLKIRQEEHEKTIIPSKRLVQAMARTAFVPRKSYIIIGSLGGFELELARWLVERGALNIVLNSENNLIKPYEKMCLKYLEQNGVQYSILTTDISTLEGCNELFQEAFKMGPIGGIFHSVMLFSDGFFKNQSAESFIKFCKAKIDGTKNLDQLSRNHCPELDHFVVFSSIICGRGSAGQSNYGFANSSMERICELRRAAGFPGLAIQWGAIDEFGDTSDKMVGALPQRISSCLSVLDKFLQTTEPVCCSYVRANKQQTKSTGTKQDLIKTISRIMGIKNHENLSLSTSLGEQGMELLMEVELKQFLDREYDAMFTTQELRSFSIEKLIEKIECQQPITEKNL